VSSYEHIAFSASGADLLEEARKHGFDFREGDDAKA
jgi:hypothetical protein